MGMGETISVEEETMLKEGRVGAADDEVVGGGSMMAAAPEETVDGGVSWAPRPERSSVLTVAGSKGSKVNDNRSREDAADEGADGGSMLAAVAGVTGDVEVCWPPRPEWPAPLEA